MTERLAPTLGFCLDTYLAGTGHTVWYYDGWYYVLPPCGIVAGMSTAEVVN